ncbi:hypothetical protein EPUS_09451 [Endocarpon pusillum Z07020]|uniref:DUF7708 domain-containing protein n=1 Tax=Endocarpon pusillum (strain Z07020 / HMAS-L-300199) TaxID=1263415 RepID=U1G382_ENDPU|nr:uncharacterized protein EPUS_09451 [Endocarpon pusillum Z07020]ERF71742.1 hypothetical protein EPUS_09451 [Endocarpon pusillum Z07020]
MTSLVPTTSSAISTPRADKQVQPVIVSVEVVEPECRSVIALRSESDTSKWYGPAEPDNEGSSIAQDAYRKAVHFCQKELKGDQNGQSIWLDDQTSMSDVLKIVSDAAMRYDLKKSHSSSVKVKANKILNMVATRVTHYGNVFDVLAQHHPEYVALAWGAMKFLFVVTLNHQELIMRIASAFTEIGDILPQVEMSANLYPNEFIKHAVANLYAQILKFCKKATKWYKRSRVMHALVAITKPYELEFKDVVDQIKLHAQKIQHLSNVSCQAEMRDMHITLRQIQNTMSRIASGNEGTPLPPGQKSTQSITPKKGRLLLENVERYLSSSIQSPEESLRSGCVFRDRRRSRGSSKISPSVWLSESLHKWASESRSSLLQITGSVVTSSACEDFALDIITLARSAGLPVVWALQSSINSVTSTVVVTDIVKSLIRQILLQHAVKFATKSSLTEECFARCATVRDWLHIYAILLSESSCTFIVVQGDENMAEVMIELGRVWKEISDRNIWAAVKMVIVSHGLGPGNDLRPYIGANCFTVSLNEGRRPGLGRGVPPGARRVSRRFPNLQSAGAEQLRPLLMELLAAEPPRTT